MNHSIYHDRLVTLHSQNTRQCCLHQTTIIHGRIRDSHVQVDSLSPAREDFVASGVVQQLIVYTYWELAGSSRYTGRRLRVFLKTLTSRSAPTHNFQLYSMATMHPREGSEGGEEGDCNGLERRKRWGPSGNHVPSPTHPCC